MTRWQAERARALVKDYGEIDHNDIVADGGVTAGMVWAKAARDLLGSLTSKETSDG